MRQDQGGQHHNLQGISRREVPEQLCSCARPVSGEQSSPSCKCHSSPAGASRCRIHTSRPPYRPVPARTNCLSLSPSQRSRRGLRWPMGPPMQMSRPMQMSHPMHMSRRVQMSHPERMLRPVQISLPVVRPTMASVGHYLRAPRGKLMAHRHPRLHLDDLHLLLDGLHLPAPPTAPPTTPPTAPSTAPSTAQLHHSSTSARMPSTLTSWPRPSSTKPAAAQCAPTHHGH